MPFKDKEKQRKFNRQWVAKRKANWFTDKVCVTCGSGVNLELDHIDPINKISHNIWSWSQVKRDEELAKCQVLCSQCHRIKTSQEQKLSFTQPLIHGYKGYRKGCRCDICHEDLLEHWRTKRKAIRDGVIGNTTDFGSVESRFEP